MLGIFRPIGVLWKVLFLLHFIITLLLLYPLFYVFLTRKQWYPMAFKLKRFCLRDYNFKALNSKGKNMKAWLHGETIVAYLESQDSSALILEDFEALKLFSGKFDLLNKVF